MEHIRKNVLTSSNWRVEKCCCCCCDPKSGTTAIGLIVLISAILEMAITNIEPPELEEQDEDSVAKAMRGQTVGMYSVTCIVDTITMGLTGALLYGNFTRKTKWMLPWVYTVLILIMIRLLFEITAILSYMFLGNFAESLPLLLIVSLSTSLSLYLWHVVRCRTLDIDDSVQTSEVIFMQRDPELPAYENVQDAGGNVPGVQPTYGSTPVAYGNVKGAYENVNASYDPQASHENVQNINEKPPAYVNEKSNN